MVQSVTARIDLREQVLNFPSQPVITKDNVTIDINAVLYYRVADPQKATYSVANLPYALETLTRTTLRNIVGEMELDSTLSSRDVINGRMREVIEEASIGWGVDVTRVELQSIVPPHDIQQSMELQMRAERERRAAVTNAEATAIERITAALPAGQASTYLLGLKYLEALPQLASGKGSTVFLPVEASGVMGALGGLRELLRAREADDTSPGSAPLKRATRPAPSASLGLPDPLRGVLGAGPERLRSDDETRDG